ncbi:hypothetical protein [Rubritalea tangerina]
MSTHLPVGAFFVAIGQQLANPTPPQHPHPIPLKNPIILAS